MWADYVEWLLGEDVYENFVHDDSGQVSYRPSWKIFTDFEYQVRKRMCYERGRTRNACGHACATFESRDS